MTIILSSNGGPHSAAQWANATAQQCIDGDDSLRAVVATTLTSIYESIMVAERSFLAQDTANILAPASDRYLPHVMRALAEITAATRWAEHFAKPAVIAALDDIVGRHVRTIVYIERSWHADRNSDHPAIKQFRGIS